MSEALMAFTCDSIYLLTDILRLFRPYWSIIKVREQAIKIELCPTAETVEPYIDRVDCGHGRQVDDFGATIDRVQKSFGPL